MIPSAVISELQHPVCAVDGRKESCDFLSNGGGVMLRMWDMNSIFPGTTVELGSPQGQVMYSIVMELGPFCQWSGLQVHH